MKKTTKVLFLLMALIMCAGLTLSALAVGDVTDAENAAETSGPDADETSVTDGATYSGACGENVRWSLNTSTGVLTISGTGAMKDFGWSGGPWLDYSSS